MKLSRIRALTSLIITARAMIIFSLVNNNNDGFDGRFGKEIKTHIQEDDNRDREEKEGGDEVVLYDDNNDMELMKLAPALIKIAESNI